MFVVSPKTKVAVSEFQRGEKVIWLPELNWLFCFALDHRARMGNYVAHYVPPGYFDLLYSFSQDRVIGIKFCTLPAQLEQENWLLARQQEDESLKASDILISCQNLAERTGDEIEPKMLGLATQFLKESDIFVPSAIWRCALLEVRQ